MTRPSTSPAPARVLPRGGRSPRSAACACVVAISAAGVLAGCSSILGDFTLAGARTDAGIRDGSAADASGDEAQGDAPGDALPEGDP